MKPTTKPTPTCTYCDRAIFWRVRGEARCTRHLLLDPWSPPKRDRLLLAIRKRETSAEVKVG